jgi:hypothetical protein
MAGSIIDRRPIQLINVPGGEAACVAVSRPAFVLLLVVFSLPDYKNGMPRRPEKLGGIIGPATLDFLRNIYLAGVDE